jgi:cytochrome c biogenesis protein
MAGVRGRVDELAEIAETAEATPAPPPRKPPGRWRALWAYGRNTWRGLTSMRTALILLFLLALGALPGALLPQSFIDPAKAQRYIQQHGAWGRLLDDLGFFHVYSSVWFSAIYVLLFVSLVGCLVPRSGEYIRAMRARPTRTPRNLERLPQHASSITSDESPGETVARAARVLKGWRVVRQVEAGGAETVSAEKGYLRETGNLVFHFAMLGLIIAFALGKVFSYSGQAIVAADGSQFCDSGIYNYDSFDPGLRVSGTDLAPFCVRVNGFQATYQPSGAALHYHANVSYQAGNHLASDTWLPYDLHENAPLHVAGDRVYLFGHGYSPVFKVRFPNGETRTKDLQWKPVDKATLLSSGATTFHPPTGDAKKLHTKQLAITGLFAPTAALRHGKLTSVWPGPRNPAVAVDVYQGDLGTGSGAGHSIFTINKQAVAQGKLTRQVRTNLVPGKSVTLADGTKITFTGVQQWVNLKIQHEPAAVWVLVFAILMLAGLIGSLSIKRRRIWVRATPGQDDDGGMRTVVEVGGLARTDQAGYGEEFGKLTERLCPQRKDV